MRDVTMTQAQGGAASAALQAQAAQEAARLQADANQLQVDANRLAEEATQKALQALEELNGLDELKELPEGAAFRVGPNGELTLVDPSEAALAAGQPGTTAGEEIPPFLLDPTIPEGVVTISVTFFIMLAVIIVGLPLARAFARRMDRNSATPPAPAGQAEQLRHIQTAVDAMAVEVERISENQRYVTRLLSEGGLPHAALPGRELAREESGRP